MDPGGPAMRACLLVMALLASLSCVVTGHGAVAVDRRLRCELRRAADLPGPADWRAAALLESGKWEFRAVARRRDGELGAIPQHALWTGWRLAGGWRLGLGSHQLRTETGAALGHLRSGLPGRLTGGLRLTPGSTSRATPEERGISLERQRGALRGGMLLADTRRDRRADGKGFVLGMEHWPQRRERVGAWRDRLDLAWLCLEGPAGWDLHGLAGRRAWADGKLDLGGLHLIRRRPGSSLAACWEEGDSRLARIQAAASSRRGRWQADAWRGRQTGSRFARPALPLGGEGSAGGASLQGRRRLDSATHAGLSLRWLEPAARSTTRSALWWRLELVHDTKKAGGLRWRLRRTAAEDRPTGSGLDAWRLALEAVRSRPWDWSLAWEQHARPAGTARLWHAQVSRSWSWRSWRGGATLHLAAGSGQGPARLEALGLAPGILRHAGLAAGRQAWGGGLWLQRGGQRVSLGLLLKETAGEAADLDQTPSLTAAWSWEPRQAATRRMRP